MQPNPVIIRSLLLLLVIFPGSLFAEERPGLRVLVWNAWRGGNEVESGPEKVLEVIRAVDPDVVLLQESYDIDGARPTLGRWMAGELGWKAHQGESPHLCILTRLEVNTEFFHHPWHGLGVKVTDSEDRAFLAWSIWLDSAAYLTWELRDQPDRSDEDLLAAEDKRSSRLPQLHALLAHLEEEGQLDAKIPLLVGGDFNTPSHLDWTVDAARVFKHRRALPLPVSLAMDEAGFLDTWRAIHPNPIQHPGITWSPMFRVAQDGGDQGFERIDRLYLRNPDGAKGAEGLRPVATHVLPTTWEDESIPPAERVFPSDHGAVVTDLVWGEP